MPDPNCPQRPGGMRMLGIASGTTPKPGATQPLQAPAQLRDHTSKNRLDGEARTHPERSIDSSQASCARPQTVAAII